jgi:phage baseplate assembly protein W
VAKWADMERRVRVLRNELADIRKMVAEIVGSPQGGQVDRLDHLRKLEALRANELSILERQLAARPY